MFTYKTKNVCDREVSFEIINNKVTNVNYEGGCNGNLKGIKALVEGMDIDEAIKRLSGISCGNKDTSCPDQLACALLEYKKTLIK